MNPLGEMIDRAIHRGAGASGLRGTLRGIAVARACALLIPCIGSPARPLRIVDPMTGLA